MLGSAVKANSSVWAGPLTGPEDLLTAKTLQRLGITPESTAESNGRQRFLALGVHSEPYLAKDRDVDSWLWRYSSEVLEGKACCSRQWVSTHYMKPQDMEHIENLKYARCNHTSERYPFLDFDAL